MPPKKKLELDPESCGHCKHFHRNEHDEYGYCRRFPPVVTHNGEGLESTSPVVESSDICGEFKRRLNS